MSFDKEKLVFIPYDRLSTIVEDILESEKRKPFILYIKNNKIPTLSSLSKEELDNWIENILTNKNLCREFGITVRQEMLTPTGDIIPAGIEIPEKNFYNIITYIESNLYFKEILKLDTEGSLSLRFGTDDFVVV